MTKGPLELVETFFKTERAGAAVTVRVSDPVLPIPPSVSETVLLVLTESPATDDWTSIETLQLLPANTLPPVNVIVLPPVAAVTVPAGHVVEAVAELTVVIPVGYVSEN